MKAAPLRPNGMLLCMFGLMIVSGTEAAVCQISATAVNFGNFSPLTLKFVESTGSITVNCTDVAVYSIALSSGSGTYNQRSMISGSYSLDYNLYRDAAHQQVWGDNSSGGNYTVTIANPVNGQNYIHTVYGRIPLSTNRGKYAGAYSDTISVIVNY
ncbi:Csu type fimbrial protein [Glaciecola punicea]|jgi:spore coat protein U-like protein|uniref:Csu type fimbrial protein n=1 Tax=Glaciecola punicea TaxID=56804 RepID=UPI0009F6C82E|nr:spore coat U domain-containing protein [Glaciecola punicea]